LKNSKNCPFTNNKRGNKILSFQHSAATQRRETSFTTPRRLFIEEKIWKSLL